MTTTETNEKTEAPIDELPVADGTAEQRDDAKKRSIDCVTAIREVLRHYNCRLHPRLDEPEPVGMYGQKIMISATNWGVLPLAPPEE